MFFFSEIFDRKITARLDGWEEKAKRLESKAALEIELLLETWTSNYSLLSTFV